MSLEDMVELENGYAAWSLGKELITANDALTRNPKMFSRHERQVLLGELEKFKKTLSKDAYDG